MKHINKFNESKSTKELLDTNNAISIIKEVILKIDNSINFIEDGGIVRLGGGSRQRGDKRIEKGKIVNITISYSEGNSFYKAKAGDIKIEFKNKEILKKFTDLILKDYSNKLSVADGSGVDRWIVTININLPIIVDYIGKYREEIEDCLLQFEDMGYKIIYYSAVTFDPRYANSNNNDVLNNLNQNNINQSPTAYYIDISKDNNRYDDGFSDDYNVTYDPELSLNKLIEIENIFKPNNIVSDIKSAIFRLKRMGLKVRFNYETHLTYSLYVICDVDKHFNEIISL